MSRTTTRLYPLIQSPIKDNPIVGEVLGPFLSEVDLKIRLVYRDIIRQDDGTDLDGGIQDDTRCQTKWLDIIGIPPQCYDTPARSTTYLLSPIRMH